MEDDKQRSTIYWDRAIREQMEAVARWNMRSLNAELMMAAQEHIERETKKRGEK